MSKNSVLKKFKEANSLQQFPRNVSPRQFFKSPERRLTLLNVRALKRQAMKKKNASFWTIYLFADNQNDRSIKMLKKIIKPAKQIQVLDFISINWNKFSLSSLSNLVSLRDFRFCFAYYFGVPRKRFNDICRYLKKFKLLKTIDFRLFNYSGFGNKELQNFSIALKSCFSLINLTSSFPHCRKITNTGLYYLSRSLKRLTLLQKINIYFSYCENVTNQGLQYLGMSLKRLELLQVIALKIDYCNQISDMGMYSLCEVANKLPVLRKISISFFSCIGITSLGEKKVKEMFQNHPGLKKIHEENSNHIAVFAEFEIK